jgi:hypothetical protein
MITSTFLINQSCCILFEPVLLNRWNSAEERYHISPTCFWRGTPLYSRKCLLIISLTRMPHLFHSSLAFHIHFSHPCVYSSDLLCESQWTSAISKPRFRTANFTSSGLTLAAMTKHSTSQRAMCPLRAAIPPEIKDAVSRNSVRTC